MARSLFARLSLEEAPSVNVNVEITPEDVVEATAAADDLNEAEQVVTEALVTLEEAEEALGELQEADNAAATALGEEPTDIVTGEPVPAESPAEGDAAASAEPVEATTDENTVDPVEVPTENQEVAAAVVQEALRHCYKKLGIDFNRVRVSYESIANQPKAALKLAREEAQEAGKSLWEKIKEFITNLIAGLKNLFAKAMSYITTNIKTLERLLNQVDSMAKDPSGNISEGLATSLFNSKEFLLTAAITSGRPKTFKDLIDSIVTVSKDGTDFANKLKGVTTVDGLQASLAEQSQYLFSKVISTDDEGKANVSIDISEIKNIPLLSKADAKSAISAVINQMNLCTKKQVPAYEEASKTLLKIAKDKELGAEAQKAFKEAGKVVSVNSKKLIKINTELMKFTAKIVLESIKAAKKARVDGTPATEDLSTTKEYTAKYIEPITEKELAETERKIGMKLPKDFREFILKCNGGYFVNKRIGNEVAERISDYRLVPWRENSSDIKILWEIKLLNEYIEEENSENRNKFKLKVNTCLPVGDNGFGDMYFITTDTKKIYLMNHETGNATLIANSFTEFYKKLEPLDD